MNWNGFRKQSHLQIAEPLEDAGGSGESSVVLKQCLSRNSQSVVGQKQFMHEEIGAEMVTVNGE